MPERLSPWPFEVIDRTKPVRLSFQGRDLAAFEGDTVATALLSAGIKVMARSFKYHRPRGLIELGVMAAEPFLNVDGRLNSRAARVPVRQGLVVTAEDRLQGDVFGLADFFPSLLPAGFYYRHFYKPGFVWSQARKVLRRAAGGGEVRPLSHRPQAELVHLTPEVLVVGGGLAGLSAARAALDSGLRVVLVEAEPGLGGFEAFQFSPQGLAELIPAVQVSPNLTLLTATTAAAVYPDGLVAAIQGLNREDGFGERTYLLRPRAVVVATGAVDRPLVFGHNDRPGVMLPQTAQRLLFSFRLPPGERILLAGGEDHLYRVALDLAGAGLVVAGLADFREKGWPEDLRAELTGRGVPVWTNSLVASALGRPAVRGAEVVRDGGSRRERVAADGLVAASGRTPLFKLLAQAGARMEYDPVLGLHKPVDLPPGFQAAGRVLGLTDPRAIALQGRLAGLRALAHLGREVRAEIDRVEEALKEFPAPPANPAQPPAAFSAKRRFICFSHDVTEADLDAALAEGFDHVETLKRYTTATMGPDQGALSQANFLDHLARKDPARFGRQAITTPRPPLVGLSLSALAAGRHDQPKLPPTHWVQLAMGGRPTRVGPWIRMDHFGDPENETLNLHQAAGLCDASTLGKFRVFGPDAEKLLDRIMTNRIGRLQGRRIHYYASCNEEGVLLDDGVVLKLGEHDYYLTTSTGRAAAAKEWLLRFRREEDWQVHVVNLTDGVAALNLAGPRAREILSRLTEADISNQALPYMHWAEAEVAGVRARVLRLGFLGELSLELHCPASQGSFLWTRLVQAGRPLGLRSCGLETQLACRLEKGHLLPGLDTDGYTTLWEAGLGWLWDKSKPDAVGGPMLRLLEGRPFNQTVVAFGLPGRVAIKEGHLVVEGEARLGYVTSVRYSAVLNQTVGLALVKPRPEFKPGGALTIWLDGREIQAPCVKPPFYDPSGQRMKS